MRLLYYPTLAGSHVEELIAGIGAHTDYECFTILRQDDVGALQVANRSGEWIDAPCIPNTFVINIGDQFARWTSEYNIGGDADVQTISSCRRATACSLSSVGTDIPSPSSSAVTTTSS